MAKNDVELRLNNRQAWLDLFQQCKPVVDEYTAKICSQANAMGKGTYRYSKWQGRVSPHGTVYTGDARSMANNRKNNTLLKAMY